MKTDYTLLIVDDEPLAREFCAKVLDWQKLCVTRVVQAGNGYEALEMVNKYAPDIMILDIKMPQMNGMELLDRLRGVDMDMQIIVSSGYSDFEAARQMLSLGKVVDYLLKPVTADAMFEAVCKCISNIEERRMMASMQKDLYGVRENLNRAWMRDFIFGQHSEDSTYAPSIQYARVAVCRFPGGEADLKHLESQENGIKYIFTENMPNSAVFVFEGSSRGIAGKSYAFCEGLAQKDVGTFGMGRLCKGVDDLKLSFQEATLACEINLFKGEKIGAFEQMEYPAGEGAPDWNRWVEEMRDLVQGRDADAIAHSLNKIFMTLLGKKAHDLQSNIPNEQELATLKSQMVVFLERVLPQQKTHLNLSAVFGAGNYYEIYIAVRDMLGVGEDLEHLNRRKYRQLIVNKVKKYIKENYQSNITLEEMAGKVFLNPSYLSRIFSECGELGFSEYVTTVRMNMAKQLLESTDLKIYEVAEQVGYRNAKYFIKVFKAREDITPAQYREKFIFSRLF